MNSNLSGNRCLTINELKKMRKIYSFMVAAAALFTAASCNKELPQEQLPVGETVVYTASVDGADTKAQLNEAGTKSEWVANDAITVHDGTNPYKFTTAQAGQNVEFSNSENFGEYRPVIAVYPYGDKYTVDVNAKTVKANIPTYQPAREETYNESAALAVAYSEGSDFAFKNAHALLKFTVKGEKSIKAIEFYGNNSEAITGDMLVTLNEDNTIASVEGQDTEFKENDQTNVMKGTWVKLYSEDEANSWCFKENVTYYAAIAPANFTEGFAINLILADDTKIEGYKKFEGELNLEASKILPLGEIEYVAPVVHEWAVAGTFNGWSTTANPMELVDGYYVAKNITGLAYGEPEAGKTESSTGFKFVNNGSTWKGAEGKAIAGTWDYVWGDGGSNIYVEDATSDAAYDIYLNPKEGDHGKFVVVPAGEAMPEDGVEAPEVTPDMDSNWALAGTFNAWGNTVFKTTSINGLFVIKNLSLDSGDEIKVKVVANWDTSYGGGIKNLKQNSWMKVYSNGSNIPVSTAGKYDVYFDLSNARLYLMAAGTEYTTAVEQTSDGPAPASPSEWYIVGNFNNWNPKDEKYRMSDDGTYYVYDNFTATSGCEMKFAPGKWSNDKGASGSFSANKWLNTGGNNIKVTAGTYKIYLKKDLSQYKFEKK